MYKERILKAIYLQNFAEFSEFETENKMISNIKVRGMVSKPEKIPRTSYFETLNELQKGGFISIERPERESGKFSLNNIGLTKKGTEFCKHYF